MPNQPLNDNHRKEALRRLKAKHGFRWHLVTYTAINFGLVTLWYFLGEPGFRGFFWPVLPIAGWAIALSYHGWVVYGTESITEAEIEHEMRNSGYTADESAEETRQRSNYPYVSEDKIFKEALPPDLSDGAIMIILLVGLGVFF